MVAEIVLWVIATVMGLLAIVAYYHTFWDDPRALIVMTAILTAGLMTWLFTRGR